MYSSSSSAGVAGDPFPLGCSLLRLAASAGVIPTQCHTLHTQYTYNTHTIHTQCHTPRLHTRAMSHSVYIWRLCLPSVSVALSIFHLYIFSLHLTMTTRASQSIITHTYTQSWKNHSHRFLHTRPKYLPCLTPHGGHQRFPVRRKTNVFARKMSSVGYLDSKYANHFTFVFCYGIFE